ncbi:hypothetical protein EOD41_10695 [Mucilaginibacter limnophilus]|uniref:Phage tail tape measure protein n=1 Tax=Mucilaginibacter limnophilus TaxID=1932778 RepID=A0A3S2V8B8_9SPHI|nr:tape measure protein [Mucilaginibacter limnophilus]RVU01074.1 hypothetical protein EOD41_10695 [Mucilaginibacter limnophilus]
MAGLDQQSVINLVINGQRARASADEIAVALNGVRAARRRLREEEDPARYRELTNQQRALTNAAREYRLEVDRNANEQKSFFADFRRGFMEINGLAGNVALGTLMANGIMAGVGALKSLISSVIQTYTVFEKFDAVLTNALGDAGSSRRALNNLQKFAAETPFSLEELTSAYVKFVNRGIIPSMDEMREMGDLAASQGKTFDQLAEAILDATTGEFERMKEFGIRAQKDGDTVKLSFKGITLEVQNSEEAIKNAILTFGKMDGVAGGMEKMSKTVGGGIANISDNWDRLLSTLGSRTGGWLQSAVSALNDHLNMLVDAVKSADQRMKEDADNYAETALKSFNKHNQQEQLAIYEGTRLRINDIEQQLARLDARYKVIRLQRGTGEEREYIENEQHDLELTLHREQAFVEAVDADRKQKAAAEVRKREQERLKEEADRKEAAKKYQQSLGQYESELESIRSSYTALAAVAQKGTIDELDAQLAVIDDKYKKLLEKLQKLAKDPHASASDKKEIGSMIKNLPGLKKQEKIQAEEKNNQQQDKEDSNAIASAYREGEANINNYYDDAGNKLNDDQAAALQLASTEEQRIQIKQEFQAKELDLQLMHYQALLTYQEQFGGSTAEIEAKISKQKLAIAENDIKNKQDSVNKQNALEEKRLEYATQITNGLASLIEVTMGNSKLGIMFQRTLTIAQMAIDTATAISAVTANNAKTSLTPIDYAIRVAAAIVTVMANMARAQAAIKSADNVPEPKATKKARKGAFIQTGPTHEQGGISVYDNKAGKELLEMERDEYIAVYSGAAYRNNKELIDKLMFNSMYNNGASVNVSSVSRAITMARQGAFIQAPGYSSNSTNPTTAPMSFVNDNSELIAAVNALNNNFEKFARKPWAFPVLDLEEEQKKIEKIRQQATM